MPTPVAWSPAFNFNFRLADAQTQLRFVQLRDGSFWVVWTDNKDTGVGSPGGTDLVGQRYDAFGVATGGEVRLNTSFFATNERNADLAADVGSNEFFIVFEDLNATGDVDIVLERKNGDGTAIGFSSIANDPTNDATGIGFQNPRVAVTSATSGLVVFLQTNADGSIDVAGQRFDPATGNLVGTRFVIGDEGGLSGAGQAVDPQVIATSDGRFAVTWSYSDTPASSFGSRGAFVDSNAAVDGFNVGQTFAFGTSVAALSGGRIVVSWNQGNNISGAVFNGDGTLFIAPTTLAGTADIERDSHVVAIGGAAFVLAFENGTTNDVILATFEANVGGFAASGSTTIASNTPSVSDIALLGLVDGRVVVGYDNPLGAAQIFDPRANANSTAVYAPSDMQIGTPGNDIFNAAANADIVHGWDGNDVITDGAGTEAQYFGGNGDDVIRFTFVDSAEGADGGPGNDTLVYLSLAGATTINLALGTATTGNVTQTVTGFEDFNASTGITQNITVTAGSAFSTLTTSDGNDILDLGTGGGLMVGRQGNDTYHVNSAFDSITELAGQGLDGVITDLLVYTLPDNVEELTFTGSLAGTFRGNVSNNSMAGGPLGDLFLLQDGGNDSAFGDGGNDGFYFGSTYANSDIVDGGAGTLDQIGLQGNYFGLTFGNLTGVELIVLLPGNDNRFGGATGTNLAYALNTTDANVAAGQILTFQANTLRAGENWALNGAAETNGFFLTFGGLGIENLTGGQQGDGFYFGTGRFNAGETLNGGGGSDQLGLQGNFAGANALTFGAGQLTSIEFVVLLSASDTRFGGGNVGQNFSYTITMNDGNVAAGQQMVIQANSLLATEVLIFNGAAEANGSFQLFGGAGNDSIVGGQLADSLTGNAGQDFIQGFGGADTLRGGTGSDFFAYGSFNDSTNGARDKILDFVTGDRIDLGSVDADTITAGSQDFELIASGASFTAAGQLRITQTGTAALIEADGNGDGIVDFAIEVTVTDSHILGLADFAGVVDNQAADHHVFDQRAIHDSWLWKSRSDQSFDALMLPVSDLLI